MWTPCSDLKTHWAINDAEGSLSFRKQEIRWGWGRALWKVKVYLSSGMSKSKVSQHHSCLKSLIQYRGGQNNRNAVLNHFKLWVSVWMCTLRPGGWKVYNWRKYTNILCCMSIFAFRKTWTAFTVTQEKFLNGLLNKTTWAAFKCNSQGWIENIKYASYSRFQLMKRLSLSCDKKTSWRDQKSSSDQLLWATTFRKVSERNIWSTSRRWK